VTVTVDTLPIKGAGLIALLTALAALGQFASSVYLPSMPAIGTSLGATAASVQLTMTAYLAAFAVMQVVYGPLADRFGRRPIMLTGCSLFVLGSLLCMTAGQIEFVILGRIVQAMGACAGAVSSRAVTRDLFEGPRLSRAMASIAMAFAAMPAIAPAVGGVLQEWVGWRATFGAAAVFGIIVLLFVTTMLRETNRSRLSSLSFSSVWNGYREVAGSRQFRAYALTVSAVMGILFAFLTGAPAVAIGELGISPVQFGLYPALSIPAFLIAGGVVRKLVARTGDAPLMRAGAWLSCLGAIAMLMLPLFGHWSALAILACISIFAGGMGFVFSLGHAGALRPFRDRAGVAASLMGVMQIGSAAVFSGLVATLAPLGALAFPVVMTVGGLAAVLFARGCR
jgi:MFS transporter, DHA1 family, multidrug resistance protein